MSTLALLPLTLEAGRAIAENDIYQGSEYQLLSAGVAPPAADDGGTGEFSVKMTNGVPVPPGVYPEVVRITFRTSAAAKRDAVCSGILLQGQHAVLTAGHCSCGVVETYRIIRKGSLEKFDSSTTEKQRNAASYRLYRSPIRFPGFICGAASGIPPGRDLALFFIHNLDEQKADAQEDEGAEAEQIKVLTRVASMRSVYATGTRQLTAAGYGITEDGSFSETLERGRIDIGSYFCSLGAFAGTPCAGFHEFVLGTVSSGSIAPPVDTCNGDSGGPVFWYPPEQVDETTGTRFFPPPALVGITSRALLFADHLPGMLCGGGGVYEAVGHSDVVDWLWSWGVVVRTVELDIAPVQ